MEPQVFFMSLVCLHFKTCHQIDDIFKRLYGEIPTYIKTNFQQGKISSCQSFKKNTSHNE